MNPEDVLRRALHEQAGNLPEAKPETLEVIRVKAHRRRLRRIGVFASACTVVVGTTVLAGISGRNPPPATDLPAGPTSIPTTTAPPPPPGQTEDDEPPALAVALSGSGRVLVIESSTGRVLRVLGEYSVGQHRRLLGISMSPDGKVVYFGHGGSIPPCQNSVYRVPVDGAPKAEKVAEGLSPELSPDGRLLAYATGGDRFGISGNRMCSNVLVVRDLSTGAERAWVPPADDGYFSLGSISSITWAPDSDRLAFEFNYEGSGVRLVDTSRPGGRLGELESLAAGQQGDNLFAPSWHPDGTIVVGAVCCAPEHDGTRRSVVVDPDTGSAAAFAGAPPFSHLDFDSTGRHVLYIEDGDKSELFRRSDGGRPVLMARDVLEADW